jgi:hypothetical protein
MTSNAKIQNKRYKHNHHDKDSMFLGKIPKVAVLATVSILVTLTLITLSIQKDAQADLVTDWDWDLTQACIDSGNCNVPTDLASTVGVPDLREAVPQQIGLQNDHQKSYLRISTSIANTGTGQWQMKAVNPATPNLPQLAEQQLLDSDGSLAFSAVVSQFEYHPAHKHFHIAAVSEYQLFTSNGPNDTDPSNNAFTGIGAEKVTFCLIDWVKISENSPNTERAYSACDGEFQGVSPGWMDQYHQELEGQELDVTNLSTGDYFLVLTANPEHHFIESDFSNNQSWVLFHYENDGKGNPKFQILNHSNCGDFPGLCEYSANR